MFFGVISCRSGSGTCWRRHRLRSAIATARLAASCPTMFLSSSETISSGVIREDIKEKRPPKRGGRAILQCARNQFGMFTVLAENVMALPDAGVAAIGGTLAV